MLSFSELVTQGSTHLWLFIPSAIVLGALHGLEPGHSKTMMAAFIIAIRGTVKQAALLGISATISHTAVVWAVALAGMHYFGGKFNAEQTEPYFQFLSGILIVAIAFWMFLRTRREQRREEIETDTHAHHHHDHGHDHHHDHGHGHHHGHHHHAPAKIHAHGNVRHIDTGHGVFELSIMEEDMPPRFWITFEQHGRAVAPPEKEVFTIETERRDGSKHLFQFESKGPYLESTEVIPEPHEFKARLSISHDGHGHEFDVEFSEHDHGHSHDGLDVSAVGYQDAHEQAHANDIRKRFANKNVTTGQIVVFGLTGGLIPCPAAITVLLLCLQLKQIPLGVTLVLCFSIGLALTMVATGTLAALSVHHMNKKFSGFGQIARRAPYISSAVIICMGLFITYQGWHTMPQHNINAILSAFSKPSH